MTSRTPLEALARRLRRLGCRSGAGTVHDTHTEEEDRRPYGDQGVRLEEETERDEDHGGPDCLALAGRGGGAHTRGSRIRHILGVLLRIQLIDLPVPLFDLRLADALRTARRHVWVAQDQIVDLCAQLLEFLFTRRW